MALITVEISTRTPDQANEPVIYRLGRDFNVVANIRRAQVTEDYAFLEIDLEGELEEVQRAVSWLHTTGLNVAAIQRSVGKDTANL
jgi:hypothetical protein